MIFNNVCLKCWVITSHCNVELESSKIFAFPWFVSNGICLGLQNVYNFCSTQKKQQQQQENWMYADDRVRRIYHTQHRKHFWEMFVDCFAIYENFNNMLNVQIFYGLVTSLYVCLFFILTKRIATSLSSNIYILCIHTEYLCFLYCFSSCHV